MYDVIQTRTDERNIKLAELPEAMRHYIDCELETFRAQGFQPITYEELLEQQGPIQEAVVLVASEHQASRNSWRSPLGFYVDTYRGLQAQTSEPTIETPIQYLALDNDSGARAGFPNDIGNPWNQIRLNRQTPSELRLIYGATGSFEYNSGISPEGHVDFHAITDLVWILQRPDATKLII